MASERWTSKLGTILAVASAAVGLGNFLRFPGKAAAYGGGVFMIPYFISLIVLGIPIAWAEWTIGRYGGKHGFHSAPGIFAKVWKHPASPYVGALALLVPFGIYVYYVYIGAWCLAYAGFYLFGSLPLSDSTASDRYGVFFNNFVGAYQDGALFSTTGLAGLGFLAICIFLNWWLVYRGLVEGIEKFCKWALPVLVILGLGILVRVLTLGTPDAMHPERSVINGLGFMWNPHAVGGANAWAALLDPQVWLEAAGQIFFTLGVAFGIIICYSSYVRKDDDIVFSAFAACATNEFTEVCMGGLITLPAAFVFLGAEPLKNVLGSTLGLAFHTFPQIFDHMLFGRWFGFMWFFLLFLAAVTSSIAMIHPVVVFLEEGLGITKARAVAILAPVSVFGSGVVVYFSKDLIALDTLDFWVGSVMIFVLGSVLALTFAWGFPLEKGLKEANTGADFPIPRFFGFMLKWFCPFYLLIILFAWLTKNAGQYVGSLGQHAGAQWAVAFVGACAVALVVLVRIAMVRWRDRLEAAEVV